MRGAIRFKTAKDVRIEQRHPGHDLCLDVVEARGDRELEPVVVHSTVPEFLEGRFHGVGVVDLGGAGAHRDAGAVDEQAEPDRGKSRFHRARVSDQGAEGRRDDILRQVVAERVQAA